MKEFITLLKDRLEYFPDSGKFFYTESLKNKSYLRGKEAGSVCGRGSKRTSKTNYFTLVINSKRYYLHRLAWIYMTGSWPEKTIDHINGDGLDNRWSNLREADRSQNNSNIALKQNNTSGYKGVSKRNTIKESYRVEIKKGHKYYYVGSYSSAEDAAKAYNEKAKELWGEFAYLNEVKENAN